MAAPAREALPRHWWLIPLVLFIVAQAFSTTVLALAKDRQESIPFGDGLQYFVQAIPADPPWGLYVAGWNGQGYRDIALNGYPTELPVTEEGESLPTTWAFYPLFPLLVKLVMGLTSLPFGFAAMLVSLLSGLGACLLLYRLILRYSSSKWAASLAVASLLLWPASPLFQLAYAEALALFFLIAMLSLVHEKKYGLAIPLVLLLGLTRPVGPPDFIIVVLHGLFHARAYLPPAQWRSGLKLAVRSKTVGKWAGLALASGFSAVLWAFLSYLGTGQPAFFMARESYSSESFFGAWFRRALETSDAYPLAPLAVMVFFLIFAGLQLRNKLLPPILRVWSIVLLAYILVVTAPVGNEYRYLFLGVFVFPWLSLPPRGPRRWAYLALVCVAGLTALYFQYQWVNVHWVSEAGALRKNV